MGKHALLEEDVRRALGPGPEPGPAHGIPNYRIILPSSPSFHAYFMVHDSHYPDPGAVSRGSPLHPLGTSRLAVRRAGHVMDWQGSRSDPRETWPHAEDWHTTTADPTVARTPPCNPPGVAPLAIDNFGSRGLEGWARAGELRLLGGIQQQLPLPDHVSGRVEATRGQFIWI